MDGKIKMDVGEKLVCGVYRRCPLGYDRYSRYPLPLQGRQNHETPFVDELFPYLNVLPVHYPSCSRGPSWSVKSCYGTRSLTEYDSIHGYTHIHTHNPPLYMSEGRGVCLLLRKFLDGPRTLVEYQFLLRYTVLDGIR